MLLTSGQVSVAISSVIVFLFTSALFLSGYVIQQHTLRDIRAAIKPQAPPPAQARMYLPEQFQERLTVPDEGVLVNMNYGGSDPTLKKTTSPKKEAKSKYSPEAKHEGDLNQKPTARVDEITPEQAEGSGGLPPGSDLAGDSGKQMEEKQLSRAERRKKIKEEILAAGEGEGFKGYRRRMW